MFNLLLLGLAACSSLIHAAPLSQDPADVAKILTRRAAVDSCPGYTASNVVTTDSGLTADLTLAGAACNAYSDDIKDLKLVVEYQTGKYLLFPPHFHPPYKSTIPHTNLVQMSVCTSRYTTPTFRFFKFKRRLSHAPRTRTPMPARPPFSLVSSRTRFPSLSSVGTAARFSLILRTSRWSSRSNTFACVPTYLLIPTSTVSVSTATLSAFTRTPTSASC
jgi:hypothetical protein